MGLSDLPLELLTQIISFTALSTPPYALHRTLSRLSLVHSHFRAPSQTILFASLRVGTQRQLSSLVELLEEGERGTVLGGYVRRLDVAEEGRGLSTGEMSRLRGRAPKLREVVFRSVEVDLEGLNGVLRQLTSLRLDNVTLVLQEGPNALPALTRLSVSNVHLRLPARSPPRSAHLPDSTPAPERFTLSLPKLHTLSFDNSLAPHLCPSLPALTLSRLASPSIQTLTIHLLSNPATDGPTAPSPLDASSHTAPTLSLFPSVVDLTLLADSSYRTPLYFPLLLTLPAPSPLERFSVLVDMGYRDKELEVKEMAGELASAIRDERGLGSALSELRLAGVFERYAGGEGMKDLLEVAKRGKISIEFED